ncbi:antibiotic biosynthesis monooxygenase [Corynebacterium macginleyi]|uniref:Antibiotic biosynthesis monooxygenase n=1 Tax=Corynebacterium macginleyi TaxID=38290 RepID=A0A3M0FZ46_9CORY|nr:putative quinol monooxygenase [Corynebacterium macginleyi]MBK4139430.1 antibiotic biosynthesis monooxygenase [Corynebacterium macginleyi]MBK4141323.1 antibiotic biosynthesis monooxygenase [Corynebacterium macginleyi]MBK4151110.1 antibiotic biosynthesis monooxygenase [Corynebacterium macginleyi]MBK4157330.1 antibiotic biosynthesis monooxygenase [Corynebacterium macginleyi]MBK4165651.1 antibiotic biosynthesis monooxygenase [Corynebacterium macginleyi]
MILINVHFHVKPEYADNFLDEINWYTDACNAEPGCIDFKWYRDPEDSQRFLLVESYADGKDVEHVQGEHFKRACNEFPKYLVETPDIINVHIDGRTGWDKMGEFAVD